MSYLTRMLSYLVRESVIFVMDTVISVFICAHTPHTMNSNTHSHTETLNPHSNTHTRAIFSQTFSHTNATLTHTLSHTTHTTLTHTVPNYLRTKLSLELEGKQKERWALANSKQGLEETAGQIKEFNQMLSHALEHVREEEERKAKAGEEETTTFHACIFRGEGRLCANAVSQSVVLHSKDVQSNSCCHQKCIRIACTLKNPTVPCCTGFPMESHRSYPISLKAVSIPSLCLISLPVSYP